VADFSGIPLTGSVPLSVQFTDASTNVPTSWAWDFGDGGVSSSQNPSHIYALVGSYDVSLTATNAGGSDVESKVGYVVVAPTYPDDRITEPEYRKEFDGRNTKNAPTAAPGSDGDYFFEQVYADGNIRIFYDGKTKFITRGGPGCTPEKGRKEGVVRSWTDNIGSMGDGVGRKA
jgi:PKD repeat protein